MGSRSTVRPGCSYRDPGVHPGLPWPACLPPKRSVVGSMCSSRATCLHLAAGTGGQEASGQAAIFPLVLRLNSLERLKRPTP